jgi:lysophospholipase L1-like esterase
VGLLLGLSGCSRDGGRRDIATPFTIDAVGDSITDGVEVGQQSAFPRLLQDKLRQEGFLGATVRNEGIPGSTLTDWVDWIDVYASDDGAIATIVELGTNDALPYHFDPVQVRSEILAIQQEVYDTGATPFFVTPPGICYEHEVVYQAQEENTLAIAEIMREVIPRERVIDASKQFHEYQDRCTRLMATHNHPNERGHQVIADLAYERVAHFLDVTLEAEPGGDPDLPTN